MKSKKSPAKKLKGEIKFEHACHNIRANIWFKLGMSKTEAAMLKTVSRRLFNGKATSAAAARALLQAALAHFDVLRPLIHRNAGYQIDEGFLTMDCYLEGVIARQHAKISGGKVTL